jgi:hypothetical protein
MNTERNQTIRELSECCGFPLEEAMSMFGNRNQTMNCNQTIRELSEYYGFSLKGAMWKFGNLVQHESVEKRLAFFKNNIFTKLQRDSPYETIHSVCMKEIEKYIQEGKLNVDYGLRDKDYDLQVFYYDYMYENVLTLLEEVSNRLCLYDVFKQEPDDTCVGEFICEIADDLATSTNPH